MASVTEQEIWAGILNSDHPENHALAFIRNFQQNVKLNDKYLDSTKMFADFVEPVSEGNIDPVNAKMLYDLKNYVLPSKFDDTNMFRWDSLYDQSLIIS